MAYLLRLESSSLRRAAFSYSSLATEVVSIFFSLEIDIFFKSLNSSFFWFCSVSKPEIHLSSGGFFSREETAVVNPAFFKMES